MLTHLGLAEDALEPVLPKPVGDPRKPLITASEWMLG